MTKLTDTTYQYAIIKIKTEQLEEMSANFYDMLYGLIVSDLDSSDEPDVLVLSSEDLKDMLTNCSDETTMNLKRIIKTKEGK